MLKPVLKASMCRSSSEDRGFQLLEPDDDDNDDDNMMMTMMMITSTTRSLDSGFVEFTLSTFSAWVLTSLNLLVVLFQALNLNCQPQHPIQCSQEWCHHTWKMGAMNHIDIFVIITIILANNLFTITIIHYLVLLYGLLEHWDNESPVHHVLPCVNVLHCNVVVVLKRIMMIIMTIMTIMIMMMTTKMRRMRWSLLH